MARISPKESTRFSRKPRTPPCAGSGFTSHARFSAVCSCTNTPVAPTTSTTMPTVDDTPKLTSGRFACSRMVPICSRPVGPIIAPTCVWSALCTSSGLTKSPVRVRIRMRSAGRENTVEYANAPALLMQSLFQKSAKLLPSSASSLLSVAITVP
jgi:hypothetical protein